MNSGPHLTTDGISAAFEELLPEREQRAADAHLAACGRCQAVLDELIGIRRALHQIGAQTPPMPTAVQGRLEAVIAAESMTRRQAGTGPGIQTSEPVAHTASRPSGSSGPRGRGSHRSKHVAPRSKPRSRKRSRRRGGSTRIFAIAAGLAVLAIGGLVTYQTMFAGRQPTVVVSQPSPSASSQAPRNPDEYLIDSPPVLTAQKFADGVDTAVKPGKPTASAASKKTFGPKTEVAPDFCPKRLVGTKTRLKILDTAAARYNGQDAYLVITRSKTPDAVDAYVVTGCPGRAALARGKTTVPISD